MIAARVRGGPLGATLLLFLTACGGGSSAAPTASPVAESPSAAASVTPTTAASPSTTTLVVPSAIQAAGKIVYCSDVSFPPEEYFDTNGTTVIGSDADIVANIDQRASLHSVMNNTGFSGIIAALDANKCDAIISGIDDTPDYEKQADFVDYLKVGQALLVVAGNPKGIHTLADLSGLSVAVQSGSTNKDSLDAQNITFKAQNKPLITIVVVDLNSDGFQQLSLGRVNAFSTDSPVAAYYANKPENVGKFEVGGNPIEPIPIGIVVRKNEPDLKKFFQDAIDAMYADGSLKTIVEKWHMTDAVVFLK
jgi:polar amino acid transport system substrate-binding protein